MSTAEPARFELSLRVSDRDIDELGHINNVVYLQWVQDAAAAHWSHAATEADREAIAWVAVRHEIDYKAPGFAGDEITVRTWVPEWTGVTSERHTEVVRAEDGKVLARAKTVWCAIDPGSQRPIRVGAEVKGRFVVG